MSPAKYQQYFRLMQEQHAQLFADFTEIHDLFGRNPVAHQAEFNEIGRKVVDAVRDWDRRLCSAMGRGQFSQYSQNLSDKFWGEVRKMFPMIDQVGVVKK